jgi:periplasmic divalent cation tolerance protein
MNARIVFCTCPDDATAARLARTLVDERLAACVNVIAGVSSTYRWKDTVQTEGEALLVIKTTAERLDAMQARLVALHPYELSEMLAIEPAAGSAPYLAWIDRETTPA